MNPAPLLAAVMLLGAACANEVNASGDTGLILAATASTERATALPATTPQPTLDPAVQCVWTDPGYSPISVHRAVNCPAGTQVTVEGYEVSSEDGSVMLCDGPSATATDDCLIIEESSSPERPALVPAGEGRTILTGTVSGHTLTLG